MDQQPNVPKWLIRLQIIFGIFLIVASIFLYYTIVPKGLDQKVVLILLGFGLLNLFFGRFLFLLPQKQKERAKKLKEEKEREMRQAAKQKAKENKAKGKKKR